MAEGVQTHYEILGIGRHATAELIRRAYRRQAQKYHPDKQPDNRQAEQCMARINEAYAVLSDPGGRTAYDRWFDARAGLLAAERGVTEATPSRFSASWPWFLLALTLSIILLSVGTVLYKEFMPPLVPAIGPAAGAAAPGRVQRPPAEAGSALTPPEAAAPAAAPGTR